MAREEARKEQQQSDEEFAKTLRLIDKRIVEIAVDEARRLAIDTLGIPREVVDTKLPEPEEEEV